MTAIEREPLVNKLYLAFRQFQVPGSRIFRGMLGTRSLGIVKSDGRLTRKRSATWRAVASWAAAISLSMRPATVPRPGKEVE